MPLIGLIPFLQNGEISNDEQETGVNALNRAYPISTLNLRSLRCQHRVSMPLIGLIPFLQALKRFYVTVIFVCQCP